MGGNCLLILWPIGVQGTVQKHTNVISVPKGNTNVDLLNAEIWLILSGTPGADLET